MNHAGKYWHDFYKRNTTNFYKDRHYLHIVFPELAPISEESVKSDQPILMLEVGCGVGNAVLPLVEVNPSLQVFAVDFAKSAIDILRSHPLAGAGPGRVSAYVCDIIRDALPPEIPTGALDIVLCFFVLSAIPPQVYCLYSYMKSAPSVPFPVNDSLRYI